MGCRPRSFAAWRVVVCLSVAMLAPRGSAAPVSYETVSVGTSLIGKFEVTIAQYRNFLEAVASASDPYRLYNDWMEKDSNISGITRSGSVGNYTYEIIGPSGANQFNQSAGNRPISYVSWFDAARFANWMSNGQGKASTETGAYTLINGATSGTAPQRNSGATFYIPTVSEWSKAAYESAVSGSWAYATKSNSPPGSLIGREPNQANVALGPFATTQSYDYSATQNYLTDVGAFSASPSAYGTFDQNGNVAEWTEGPGSSVRALGSSWSDSESTVLTRSGGITFSLDYEGSDVGFRLGGIYVPPPPPPPPPPTEIVIDVPAGQTIRQSESPYAKPALDVTLPVRKTGAGTFIFDQANTLSGSLTVENGTALLSNAGALPQSQMVPLGGGTLAIAAGLDVTVAGIAPMAGGVIDIGSGKVTVAGLPPQTALQAIIAGLGDGAWNGTRGVRPSPFVPDSRRRVGWSDNGDGTLTMGYAAPGDTNLDWNVDILDASNLLSAGKYDSPAVWTEGDFNYDGLFDILDAAAIFSAGLYNAGTYNSSASASVIAVPEPTYLSQAILVALLGASLRRQAIRARK